MINEVKSFWNKVPCDSLNSDKQEGTREYFSEIAQHRYNLVPEIISFADFHRWMGRKVLEIGCGIGNDTLNFARACADVTAIDLSEDSLELAKQNFDVWGNKARFFQLNIENTGELLYTFYPEKFDLIYSFGVLHHTPNPSRAFKNIRLLCDAQTELRVMLYAKYSFHTLWVLIKGKGAFWKFSQLLSDNAEAQYGCPVAYHYTFNEIRKLLKDYQILEMKKGYLSRLRKYIPTPFRSLLSRLLGGYIFIVAKARFE